MQKNRKKQVLAALMAMGMTVSMGYGVEAEKVVITDGMYVNEAIGSSTTDKDAVGGQIDIQGGWVFNVYSGFAMSTKDSISATGNSITITGGTVGKSQSGRAGAITAGAANGGSTTTGVGTASDNTITISGGNIYNSVMGGYVSIFIGKDEQGNRLNRGGVLNGNHVIIKKNGAGKPDADLSQADLFGYNNDAGIDFDSSKTFHTETKGNTLTFDGWRGKVRSIHNFNVIEFNNLEWKNGDTVIHATGGEVIEGSGHSFDGIYFVKEQNANGTQGKGTEIKVNSFAGGQTFKDGDRMHLIQSDQAFTETKENLDGVYLKDKAILAGVAQNVTIYPDYPVGDKYIDLVVKGGGTVTDQTKVVTGGSNGGIALLNQGADLLSSMTWANKYGLEVFGIVSGNKSKYDTNNDLKLYGWTEVAGVGSKRRQDGGDFAWAVFYEHGDGNYVTHSDMLGIPVRGDGEISYDGGGLMGRYDKDNGKYAELSLHVGHISDELKNGLMDGKGKLYNYKTGATYWSFHAGLGQIKDKKDNDTLDTYVKYFYSHIDGDSFTVAGDQFELDSAKSSRLRAGFRFNDYKTEKKTFYYGIAYDYEFEGKSTGRAQGLDIQSSSLKGGTVIGEIGMNYEASEKWTFDSTFYGFAGEREGLGGKVQATYHF